MARSLFLLLYTLSISSAYQVIILDDVSLSLLKTNNISLENRMSIILPGTNWCGSGNVSKNNDDLGLFKDLDFCCRTHDRCPDFIGFGETKHGLRNPSFFSRLTCDCDHGLHECLKNVKSNVRQAKLIGRIYFDFLRTKCFKLEYPYVCKKLR